jgi:hypothetical protein
LGIAVPFRIAFPFERLHPVHTFFLRPFQRCRCPIRKEVVVVEPAARAEVAATEVQVEAAPAAGVQEAVEAAPEEAVQAVAVPEEEAARAAPVELEVQEGAPGAAPVARVAALAAGGSLLLLTSTTRPTTSRGQSCLHSRLRHRPISRFWLRCPMEQAVS